MNLMIDYVLIISNKTRLFCSLQGPPKQFSSSEEYLLQVYMVTLVDFVLGHTQMEVS